MNTQRSVVFTRWLLSISALGCIVLLFRLWLHVNATTVALTLLLLVLVLATEWGLRYAVVVSIAATACYNFFFLPPVGTFTISDPQNWLALFAFLATAILASRLSHRARNQAREAQARQRELEVLFRLSREMLQIDSVAELLNNVTSTIASVIAARGCALYLIEGNRLFQSGYDHTRDIERPHFQQLAETLPGVKYEGNEILLPLRTGVRPRGVILLTGATLTERTATAVGDLVSVTLDRAQALENLARGEAAKESERLRNLIIDSITHELRTPLTSIKGSATSLLSGEWDSASSRELLTIIDEESDRLNNLVSDAVQVARLDSQQVRMTFETVNVASLVRDVSEICAWVRESHELRLDVPGDLHVKGDPEFLRKVLTNLIENAAKYSGQGSPITVSAERKQGEVRISVADRGIGIDPTEQTLIFERFYRARGQEKLITGTGMGLAISRAITEAHGGQLTVLSQPGQGSVFTLTLETAIPEPGAAD